MWSSWWAILLGLVVRAACIHESHERAEGAEGAEITSGEVCVVMFDTRFKDDESGLSSVDFATKWASSNATSLVSALRDELEDGAPLPFYALAARANLLYAASHG